MFYAFAYLLLFGMAYLGIRRGPHAALWGGWMFALLLVPAWVVIPIGTFTLDLRTVAAVAGLAAVWLMQPRDLGGRWLLADLLVALLILVQVIAEYQAGQLGPLAVPEILRKWLLPYLVGRWFLGNIGDVGRVLPYFCWAMLLVSLYGIAEAASHVNFFNHLVGKVYGPLEEGAGYRWGLKRAQGFLDHPIYFGNLIVLLFPWVLEARRRSALGEGPRWWRALPFIVFGALLSTASRGPLLAAVFCAVAPVFFSRPRWRLPIVCAVVLTLVVVIQGKALVVEALSQWAGEEDELPTLVIRGEEVEYSGTKHRLLLHQAYEDGLENLGLFGFWLGPARHRSRCRFRLRFRSIDDHYLLFLLQIPAPWA